MIFPHITHADTFEIMLQYDQSKNFLSFDARESLPVKQDINKSISIYDYEDAVTKGPFEYVIFDVTGYEMDRKQFTPQQGYFSLELPYYSIAKTLKIKRVDSDEYILSQDLSDFVTCNANSICELENKETIESCIVDCAKDNVTYSQETKAKLEAASGIIRDPQTGNILLSNIPVEVNQDANTNTSTNTTTNTTPSTAVVIIATIVFLAVLGGGIYYVVKKW